MNKPVVIIVTGLPCTGKTTIAHRIGNKFCIPVTGKDRYKELLFDTLGSKDRKWSIELDRPSIELIFQFLEIQLTSKQSCIVESPFSTQTDTHRFFALKAKYEFEIVQVLCVANGEILVKRFRDRAESGSRHPGHCDHQTYEEHYPILIKGRIEPLNIDGLTIEVDTTDFERVNYNLIFSEIANVMKK